MRYKTGGASIPDIAQALGVELIVEGSVLQSGARVRVTAQLIDAAADAHLWAESYNRRLNDVIELQGDVANAIASAIQGTVARLPRRSDGPPPDIEPAVYDLYLRGRHAWYRRTAESLDQAIDFFTRAVDRAPDFALAHVGLADAHVLKASPTAGLREVQQHMDRARASATRALDLDATLAEAHTALGSVLFFGERDFRGAELAFTRAIELNPNYAVAHEYAPEGGARAAWRRQAGRRSSAGGGHRGLRCRVPRPGAAGRRRQPAAGAGLRSDLRAAAPRSALELAGRTAATPDDHIANWKRPIKLQCTGTPTSGARSMSLNDSRMALPCSLNQRFRIHESPKVQTSSVLRSRLTARGLAKAGSP